MNTSYHAGGRKSIFGYVYILKSESGHYKIGKSVRPDERVSYFTVHLPFKIKIVHLIPSEDYTGLETYMHRLCSRYHVNGEWFALPEPHVAYIKAHIPFVSAKDVQEFLTDGVEESQELLDSVVSNWIAREEAKA